MRMARIKTKLVADFETTTEAVDPNRSWVWAWYYTDIYNRDVKQYGSSIDDFFTSLESSYKSVVVYFHNLKFDGIFIMDYLLRKRGATCLDSNEEPKENTFSILMNKQGIIYSIEYHLTVGQGQRIIRFLDSMKILPFSVEVIAKTFDLKDRKLSIDYDVYRSDHHTMSPEEKAYITNDVNIIADALLLMFNEGDTKMTASSNALASYKKSLGGEKVFRSLFPVLDKVYNENVRKAYHGGFVYVNPNFKQRELKNLMVFDMNSMYPSQMKTKLLPYGNPHYFEGEYNGTDPLYIQHLQCGFKIKKGYVPFIQLKSDGFLKTEYVRDSYRGGEGVQDIYLTNIELPLFFEHYRVYELEYVNGYSFDGAYNLFDDYVNYYYDIKQNETGALRQQAKLKLNSLYGKFATNVDTVGRLAVLEDPPKTYDNRSKIVRFVDSSEPDNRDPIYTPMSVFITSYARACLLDVIDKLGGEKKDSLFVYCDTDSVHIIKPKNLKRIDFLPIDNKKLNCWKCESEPKRGYFIGAKTYIEEYPDNSLNIRACGMPKNVKNECTFNNFKVGFTSPHKLMPRVVEGGVLLTERDFKLKERSFMY